MKARMYDPTIGRFLSTDPIKVGDSALDVNPYIYVNNSPLTRIDPSGKFLIPALLIFYALTAVSAYYAYKDIKTLVNPNSSKSDKLWAAGGLAVAAVAPEVRGGKAAAEGVVNAAKASKTAWTAARNGRGTAVEAVANVQHNAIRNTTARLVKGAEGGARWRIFDNSFIKNGVDYIGETKGGKYQSWDKQLRDHVVNAKELEKKPALLTPPSTHLTRPLLDAAKAGKITIFDDLLIK